MTPEGYVVKAVLDLLAAEHVLGFRMNTGAVTAGTRFFRFGSRGMSDIVAFPHGSVLWIEAKSEKGRQTAEQRSFQELVEFHGHSYLLARSSDDVLAWPRR